jgi:hypothetical protein
MVYFKTKNPNLVKIWRALEWKSLLYFMTIWNIFQSIGIIYSRLVYFVVIWFIFPVLVGLDQEKSGSPDQNAFLGPMLWSLFLAIFTNVVFLETYVEVIIFYQNQFAIPAGYINAYYLCMCLIQITNNKNSVQMYVHTTRLQA